MYGDDLELFGVEYVLSYKRFVDGDICTTHSCLPSHYSKIDQLSAVLGVINSPTCSRLRVNVASRMAKAKWRKLNGTKDSIAL